jgi:hypothetical protein
LKVIDKTGPTLGNTYDTGQAGSSPPGWRSRLPVGCPDQAGVVAQRGRHDIEVVRKVCPTT